MLHKMLVSEDTVRCAIPVIACCCLTTGSFAMHVTNYFSYKFVISCPQRHHAQASLLSIESFWLKSVPKDRVILCVIQ